MAKRSLFKMLGGALSCPPGFVCMDYSTVIFGVLLVLIILGAVIYVFKPSQASHAHHPPRSSYKPMKEYTPEPVKPTVIVVQAPTAPRPEPTMHTRNPDPRFSPLAPEQSYETPPDYSGFPSPPISAGRGPYVPINIQTRGAPDTFQQVGLLTTAGGTETSATPNRTILPLFGRKLITNRDRWNYYTRTDGINPVQVPIQYKRRNCDDDNGCDEIMEGDSIGVPIMGQSYIANIYRYSIPRYIPTV